LSESHELILAQEQDVQVKEMEPSKLKDLVGSLILTDQRLLFVEANEEHVYYIGSGILSKRSATFRYANIDDLAEIASNPNNFTISLNVISTAVGSEGILHPPELKVTWKTSDGSNARAVFKQELLTRRKKDLKDWAKVILGLKSGAIKIQRPNAIPPSIESLDGKILHVLGDMQEKGLFEIEEETERQFKQDLDPDSVEESCNRLVSQGFADKEVDSSGEPFFRKRSPLGEDNLSS
jgi:hypothetical protein